MGAVPWGDVVAPGSTTNWSQICFNFPSKWPRISPRSGRDRATIVVLVIRRSPSDRLEKVSLRQLPDYGSIAPRSRLDRAAIAEFFHASSGPSDEDRYLMKIRRAREFHAASMEAVRSRSRDLQLMMIGRFSRRHVVIGEPSDRRHLSLFFAHVVDLMIAWTRVHAIVTVLITSDVCLAAT